MITSRTPLRVSFFGGGTDYPEYFDRAPGAVVGMAINKYIYLSALKLATFIDYKYRISYSRLEMVGAIEDIQHPVVRSVFAHYGVHDALDLSVISDLPASSGLGSSSAFTVGLINLVSALQSRTLTRLDLGRRAIHVERELLNEHVGVQDQLHAAFGGINRFDFIDGRIRISPIQMTSDCLERLTASLVLVYTGVQRSASATLAEQIKSTKEKQIDVGLSHLMTLTNQAVAVLEGTNPDALLKEFGGMLHDGWMIKRSLSQRISSDTIDELYEAVCSAGALGGKLCGAGAGGFLLAVVPPEIRQRFCAALPGRYIVPIDLDPLGSTILSG